LKEVVEQSQVIILATRVDNDELKKLLRPDHIVIDLVNLDRDRRLAVERYEGICW
jgi:hypothetical protein